MDDKQFYNYLKEMVTDIIRSEGLLVNEWHLGKVASVVSSKKLTVYVDGSTQAQTISCNPDVTFVVNDYVWVVYINGNPRDKFALCKRAV